MPSYRFVFDFYSLEMEEERAYNELSLLGPHQSAASQGAAAAAAAVAAVGGATPGGAAAALPPG